MASRAERLRRYSSVSRALAALSDRDVAHRLAEAEPLGAGIGGSTVRLELDGVPVFVKRVPLTDLERDVQPAGSTGNLFDLPVFCHYGIGSPGFGAWREVAAHQLTTQWVLAGQTHAFPLMYHARVLPGEPAQLPAELSDIELAVSYWDGSTAVRQRIEALRDASSHVWMFLELLPRTAGSWLAEQGAEGTRAVEAACRMVERELHAAADVMADQGFLHMDAHLENVLTDGEHLYLGDLGLAMSRRFDLSPVELTFFGGHVDFDRSYVFTQLVRWLLSEVDPLTPVVARVVRQYEPIAAITTPFYHELQTASRTLVYPSSLERDAWGQVPHGDPTDGSR